MNNFRRCFIQALHRETYRALHAVEVVVEALAGEDHHGRRHAQQCKLGAQVVLKHVLDGLDGLFRLFYAAQKVAVIAGNG